MIKHLQNKTFRTLLLALILGLSGTANLFAQFPEGAVHGAFSVSDSTGVYFSQGNLQYQASTNTWRFAENQWDLVGSQTNPVGEYHNGTVSGSDNSNISQTYSGWIDLFGWGTSGYNHGANCYQPWSTSNDDSDYYAYGSSSYNLFDLTGQADWGYNAISNGGNRENSGWRTMTGEEWYYVFNTRSTPSGIRYAKATVSGAPNIYVYGVILLPDNWSADYYSFNNTNTSDAFYGVNQLTLTQWNTLEQHGAVFLPVTGQREGTDVYESASVGLYWSSSLGSVLEFYDSYLTFSGFNRSMGASVRLVHPVPVDISARPSPLEGGTVTGEGTFYPGDECTLTAMTSTGYIFANWMENGVVVSTDVSYTFTITRQRNLKVNFVTEGNILFNDANVKTLCVANWDSNNDGELSYAEAAAVTSIGTVFKGNTNIESFNELQHFISLTAIDEQAFRNCSNLAEITIPEYVTSIGSRAFWNCPSLATVHFNAINCTSMYNVINEENHSVFMSSTTSHPLTNLTFSDNVQHIPDYAFRGCDHIQNLDLSALDITVGQYAFYGCSNLETLTIGEGVTSIGGYAFWNCPALSTVHFNAVNCTFTGNYSVFRSGTNSNDPVPIVTLTFGENVTTIPDYAFASWDPKEDEIFLTGNLILPNSLTSIGQYAFSYCKGLSGDLIIPNSVISIGQGAFSECSGFTGSLIIPNSVTTIEQVAFDGCSGLTGSLTIPNSVTTIKYGTFLRCGFTGDLIIPNSVTSIEGAAFYLCEGLTGDIIIPNSVTTIGPEAFAGCSGFSGKLIIPNSVTTIGPNAFARCSVTALISESTVPPTMTDNLFDAFGGMDYSIPVYVPAGKVFDYQNANGWRNFTNYKSQVNFAQDSNDQWSDDENWSSWEVPDAEDVVCITDNCLLDVDANVLYVYIADDAKVLTVNSGKTLNTTYGVHIENASQLVVENGAQVISDIPFSGTVKKHIDAYTSKDDGWNFIASPVTEDQSISGLFPTGGSIYDLYYLDEENTYWRNYKVNAFDINHNQGYLYANQAGTDINFSGTMQPYVADGVSIPLTKEGEGWNLVGNPFTFNAYANKPYYVINGRNIEAAASGAIAPCTGIVVKANGTENETVKFTKDAPAGSSAQNHGSLKIALTETSTRSVSQIDNAIVSFNESETLPKFRFGDNAQIYLLQNNEDYAVANAETAGEMPVNFKATRNGEYTLTVNPENVEMEYLHLIDNLTGNDVDLLATPSYNFQARTDDYASRFRLVFSANSINENNAEPDNDFAFISNGELIINGTGTFQVIDMLGRQLFSREANSDFRLQTSDFFTSGVYVLRLVNGENIKTQKIVIK